ncbi:hypothetical protein DL98DRAFT_523139 [Cadophora sp. DSE1049]|nr:hypothetical protein DL98DRAFT_523139 [Cadophora sp. DSE1049]
MARTRLIARTGVKTHSKISCSAYPFRSTTKRSQWTDYGCSIYGWPLVGGVIMRESCDLVELRYLGFDPLDVPKTRLEN